jgi:hypothetical protein
MLTLAVGLLAGSGAAQETEPDQLEPPDQYEVELIVFRLTDQSRTTPETASAEAVPRIDPDIAPPDELTQSLAPERPEPPRALLDDDNLFVPLNADRLQLTSVYRRLQEIDAYAPLLHTGWVQQARSTTEAIPNRLGRSSGGQSRLTGSVTLYKQRFLHLNIDLALESLAGAPRTDERVFGDSSFVEAPTRPAMRLQESRRIRGGDVNYFDHPQMGIIVTVREIKTADG